MFNFYSPILVLTVLLGLSLLEARLILSEGKSMKWSAHCAGCRKKKNHKIFLIWKIIWEIKLCIYVHFFNLLIERNWFLILWEKIRENNSWIFISSIKWFYENFSKWDKKILFYFSEPSNFVKLKYILLWSISRKIMIQLDNSLFTSIFFFTFFFQNLFIGFDLTEKFHIL